MLPVMNEVIPIYLNSQFLCDQIFMLSTSNFLIIHSVSSTKNSLHEFIEQLGF